MGKKIERWFGKLTRPEQLELCRLFVRVYVVNGLFEEARGMQKAAQVVKELQRISGISELEIKRIEREERKKIATIRRFMTIEAE